MDVRELLWKAHGLADPGAASDQQRAALHLANALDGIERSVAFVTDALQIIEPLLPQEEARGYVAARLQALADELQDAT